MAIDGRVLLTRERRPEDMRYLLQQSFVLPGLSVKQVFDDRVAFESFVEDFPDFVRTAKANEDFPRERRMIEVYAVLASIRNFVCWMSRSLYDALHVQKMKR